MQGQHDPLSLPGARSKFPRVRRIAINKAPDDDLCYSDSQMADIVSIRIAMSEAPDDEVLWIRSVIKLTRTAK